MTDNDDHDNDRHTIAEEYASAANNISLRAEADYYVEDGLMRTFFGSVVTAAKVPVGIAPMDM